MAHSFDDTDSSHYAGCPLRTYSYEVGSGDTFPLCECNRIATLATKPIVTLDQLNAELKRQAQLIADANGVMMEQAKAIAAQREVIERLANWVLTIAGDNMGDLDRAVLFGAVESLNPKTENEGA